VKWESLFAPCCKCADNRVKASQTKLCKLENIFINDLYAFVFILFVSNDRRVLKPFLDKFTPLLPFVPKIAI